MSSSWQQQLDGAIDARKRQLIELRRHLHQNPEISGDELETSLHLYRLLDEEGFDVRMGPDGRGVLADLAADEASPRIAIRADIDALQIQDEKQVDYHSRRPGVMHACGHDAHTATVVGAIAAIKDLNQKHQLPWPVDIRGLFQPSEETATGANEMVQAGAVENTRAILAAHVDPTRTVGTIGIRTGVLTANCDGMRLTVGGRGGHAARPHETIDPIAAAAQLINSIYLTVPRVTDSQDAVVVTIGQIVGGANPNVIPEHVELLGTLRTLDEPVRKRTMEHIQQICRGVGQSTGTQIDVNFLSCIPSVRNDAGLAELLRRVGADLLGQQQIEEIPRASMGSEDFAVYLNEVPGAMFRLGSASPGKRGTPLHTPTFDVDESAIVIGAKILARAAVTCCRPDSVTSSHDGEDL